MDDGGEEARVKANVCNKEVKQSKMTKVHVCDKEIKQSMKTKVNVCDKETKQTSKSKDVGQLDTKDVIIKSNKDNASVEVMVNSNTTAYHESGQSGKHTMWSLKELEESMPLKN